MSNAGQVTLQPPAPPPPLPGGILGDEMGLGKTAEVHALMCARPRPAAAMPAEQDTSSTPSSHAQPVRMDTHQTANADADSLDDRQDSAQLATTSMRSKGKGFKPMGGEGPAPQGYGKRSAGGSRGGLVPGHNLVVCPSQLKDQWINEACALLCPALLCPPLLCCAVLLAVVALVLCLCCLCACVPLSNLCRILLTGQLASCSTTWQRQVPSCTVSHLSSAKLVACLS